MRKKEFVKKGLAFSIALAMGLGGVAPVGLAGTAAVYAAEQTALCEFNFNDGISGWHYGTGWEYEYSGAKNSSVEADNGQLKINLDYSGDKEKSWSQAVAVWEPTDQKGVNLSGASHKRSSCRGRHRYLVGTYAELCHSKEKYEVQKIRAVLCEIHF